MSAQYKITVDRGTDYRLALQVGSTDDTDTFTPDDISADAFVLSIDDPDDPHWWTGQGSESAEVLVDGSYVRLHFFPGLTSHFNAHKRYAYSLDRIFVSGAGDRKRILAGPLYARPGA